MLNFTSPPLILTGHEAAVYALCPWQDGVLSGGGDGMIVHWRPQTSSDGLLLARVDDRVFAMLPVLKVGGLSAKLVVGTLSGDIYWIDTTQPQLPPKRWRLHGDGAFGLLHLEDHVFVTGGKGRLSRWHIASGELDKVVQLDSVRLRSIAVLKRSGLLAIGTANGDIHLVDPVSLRIVHSLALAHHLTVFALLDAGDRFYSAGRDGAIRCWDTEAPFRQVSVVAAHGATVNALLAYEGLVVSAGRDRELRFWEPGASPDQPLTLRKVLTGARDHGHVASVNAVCCSSGTLLSGGDDRTIRWWGEPDRQAAPSS